MYVYIRRKQQVAFRQQCRSPLNIDSPTEVVLDGPVHFKMGILKRSICIHKIHIRARTFNKAQRLRNVPILFD